MDTLKKINELLKNLKKWEYEYYEENNPSVLDVEYDLNLKELIKLENEYPQFKTYDSPTQRVGGSISSKFKKVKHSEKMLSLSNAFNLEDLNKFDDDISKFSPILRKYVVEPKIDGLSITLIYDNGFLIQALTRGDGNYGEDVTTNIKTIHDVPLKIDYLAKLEVRGEVYFSSENFKKLNKSEVVKFANPRNAAAGSIRNLDSSIVAKRNLSCFIYMLIDPAKHDIFNQYDAIKFIKKHNFKVPKEIQLLETINKVQQRIKEFQDIRKKINYEIDGIVIKYNDFQKYDAIGYTSKFPKWAIAYKFPAEIKKSKIIAIDVSVGRTGKINYIARISPVEINGTIVSNATLHNFNYIKDKDIQINDSVNVFKAGEIIPKIIDVNLEERDGTQQKFLRPTNCPSCGLNLISFESNVDIYCLNEKCDEKIVESISHFCGRSAMNIDGLSIKIIKKLYFSGFIKTWVDIYNLENKKTEIINKDLLLKEKSLSNLFKSINISKNNSLERLIFALGIRHIGETSAKILAKNFRSIEKIASASIEELSLIIEIGEKMAQSIKEFFAINLIENILSDLNKHQINYTYKLENSGIIVKNEDFKKYSNKKILITGTFSESRKKIKTILEDNFGIKVVSSLTKETNFILSGENATNSKILAGKALNIPIIYKEFWNN